MIWDLDEKAPLEIEDWEEQDDESEDDIPRMH